MAQNGLNYNQLDHVKCIGVGSTGEMISFAEFKRRYIDTTAYETTVIDGAVHVQVDGQWVLLTEGTMINGQTVITKTSPNHQRKLKNNMLRNEESFPEIFGLSESEVLEAMEAAREYEACGQSYQDWLKMYNGIHRESTHESVQRAWLACYRWLKPKDAISSPILSPVQEGTFTCQACKHELGLDMQVRTKGYCYLCDPNITLEECLSDEPLTE